MNFQIKKGIIADQRTTTYGNMFPVQVIPEMAEIEQEELFPLYTNFFHDKQIAYMPDDTVWCLTSDDFEVGFILGKDTPTAGDSLNTFILRINEIERDLGVPPSGYGELSIIRFSNASFMYENTVSGSSGTIYSSGAITIFGSDGSFYFSPPNQQLSVYCDPQGGLAINGTTYKENFSEKESEVGGVSSEKVGAKVIESGSNLSLSASGNLSTVAMTSESVSLGDSNDTILGEQNVTVGKGEKKNIVTGGITENILAGDHNETLVTGNFSLSLTAGTLSLFATAGVNITSATAISVTAPIVRTPNGLVAPTGSGGLCALPLCLFTGAPHVGTTLVGT